MFVYNDGNDSRINVVIIINVNYLISWQKIHRQTAAEKERLKIARRSKTGKQASG